MKQNWTYKKLGEVVAITMGQSPASDTYNESEGLPFFQGNADFGKEHPSVRIYCNSPIRIADSSDILISVRAPIGAINIADRKCCIGRGLAAIRGNDNYMSRFIYYLLMASKEKLVSQGTGSTFKSIGKDVLYNMLIPVPPLSTQSRIVSELDLLQSIIDKQKTQLKELDNLAQAIFYDMFGDILESAPTKFFKDVADYYIGLTYSPTDVAENGTVVLRSSNIQNNVLDFEDTVRVNMVISDKKMVQDGDILMCARNGSARLVGKVARIKNLLEKMSFGAFMTIIRSPYNDFLFQFFLSHYFRNQLTTSKTATINQITTKMLDGIRLNVPSLEQQQSFAQKVESIERQKELINQSIREAQTLFDSRMEYYFGE